MKKYLALAVLFGALTIGAGTSYARSSWAFSFGYGGGCGYPAVSFGYGHYGGYYRSYGYGYYGGGYVCPPPAAYCPPPAPRYTYPRYYNSYRSYPRSGCW